MIGEIITKLVVKPLAASATAARAGIVALTSVCEHLLWLVTGTVVEDIARVKKSQMKRLTAQANSEQAEARKKLAEATTAANQITRRSHADEVARLELERLTLENQKRAAEVAEAKAKAGKANVENARAVMDLYLDALNVAKQCRERNLEASKQALFDALQCLQRENGMLYVNEPELQKLLQELREKPPGDKPELKS